MKGLMQKLRLPLAAFCLTASVIDSHSLTLFICANDVSYFNGPPQNFYYEPAEPTDGSIDLNLDGIPDFGFHQPYFLCTADVPTSACSGPYQVVPLGSNAVLAAGSSATMLGFAMQVGDNSGTWRTQSQATVVTHFISERYRTNTLVGPLAEVGVGYLGVKFYAADGLHYGWFRLRLAPFISVVDWAYEHHPEAPICAGTIGSLTDSIQLDVDFRGPNGLPPGSKGSFILTGNTVRGELTLAGSFASADIVGPAPAARARSKPRGNLGQPLVMRSDYTSFLGDITLSEAEIQHLLRGNLQVSLDGGRAIGGIVRLR